MTILRQDVFSGPDGALDAASDGLGNWIFNAGLWVRDAHSARLQDGATQATAVLEAGQADVDIKCQFNNCNATTDAGLCFRSEGSTEHFVLTAGGPGSSGSDARIFSRTASGFGSALATAAGVTFSTADFARVVCAGTAIEVFKNSTSIMTLTSSAHLTGTKHGFRSHGNIETLFNSFTIETVSAGLIASLVAARYRDTLRNLVARF